MELSQLGRDLFMMLLGIVIFVVVVGFYEILFNYSKMKEEEFEEIPLRKKGWIKRGWNNMCRDIKKRFFVREKKKNGRRARNTIIHNK